MAQSWHDLLFAHWPVAVDVLRGAIPPGLELDRYEGRAWLGVVPFRMSGIRPRWLPAMPRLSAFPELNVRSYVTAGGKPGVWFFALDAANPLAVAFARRRYRLPYFLARMSALVAGDGVAYASRRVHRGAPPAVFRGTYRPVGEPFRAEPGSLAHWLTERYCLYSADRRGRLYRGEIDHPPWALQPAAAEIAANTMAAAHGIDLPDDPPLLHFARRQDVVVWPIRAVAR